MKYFDYYKDDMYVASGTADQLAKQLKMTAHSVRRLSADQYIHSPTIANKVYYVADRFEVYALYSGDEIEAMGSLVEISEKTGIGVNSLKWFATPTGIKRSNGQRAVIKLEDEYVIQRRTGVKYARKPVELEHETATVPEVRIKSVKPAVWKPNPYTRMLFDHMFKRWDVEA